MNFSEFKRLLNSDPGNQDPEFLAARRANPEFAHAAAASDAFEQRLKKASHLPVDPRLAGSLKALAQTALEQTTGSAESSMFYRFRYALAASVILAVSAAVLIPQSRQPQGSVEAYVSQHFSLDGFEMLEQAGIPQTEELAAILAAFDLQMDSGLASQVQFVKYCPTPEGMGVHLVLNSPQGRVTVIFMPGLVVPEGQHFAFNDMAAELINLTDRNVSAAIIGQPEQLTPALGQAIAQGVVRLSTGA